MSKKPTAKARGKTANHDELNNGIRYGSLQFAIAVLGYAAIGHITGAYTVTELTGKMHIVRLHHDGPYCLTHDSYNDDHTALIRLYLARLGKPVGGVT